MLLGVDGPSHFAVGIAACTAGGGCTCRNSRWRRARFRTRMGHVPVSWQQRTDRYWRHRGVRHRALVGSAPPVAGQSPVGVPGGGGSSGRRPAWRSPPAGPAAWPSLGQPRVGQPVGGVVARQPVVWSPDSHWLFVMPAPALPAAPPGRSTRTAVSSGHSPTRSRSLRER
jgi:hypothetical protein